MEKAFAFEPNRSIFEELEKKFSGDARVKAINAGVWNIKKRIAFDFEDSRGSRANPEADNFLDVVSIDDTLRNEYVSFIKMDVEGAEKEALAGAEKTIMQYRPNLAICVYHKREDLIEIPLFINRLVPEYKIYLRHHTKGCAETVCYATL
jgi:FkbM family methyltransferase